MKKILLLASLLGITISAQAATLQCPPANAISYSSAAKKWILDSAYASQWTVYFNMLGKQDKEQVYPLAVLRTYSENSTQMICDYSTSYNSQSGVLDISLWSNGGTFSFPPSNPYFHQIPGAKDYLCITSGSSPEVCQWQ
jgi:hypothetical protein